MLPKSPTLADSSSLPGTGNAGRAPEAPAGRRHWLCGELVMHSVAVVGTSPLSPSVVDIEGELAFWRKHHQRTAAWHRDVLPFHEYVPAFTLGISLFLQCHDCLLDALDEQMLALRYARLRRASRVEWHEARQAVHAGYLRLQAHRETSVVRVNDPDVSPIALARTPGRRANTLPHKDRVIRHDRRRPMK